MHDRRPLRTKASRLRCDETHVAAAGQRHEPAGDADESQSEEPARQRAVQRHAREVQGSPRAEAESGKASRDKVGTGQHEQAGAGQQRQQRHDDNEEEQEEQVQ